MGLLIALATLLVILVGLATSCTPAGPADAAPADEVTAGDGRGAGTGGATPDCEEPEIDPAAFEQHCLDGRDAPGTADQRALRAEVGEVFRHGPFEVTVIEVELGVTELVNTPPGEDYALEPTRPVRGQFGVAHLRVTNVSQAPAYFSSTDSELDAAGNTYTTDELYTPAGQGLDEDQDPGTTVTGYLIFDLPTSIKRLTALEVRPDPADALPPTRIAFDQ